MARPELDTLLNLDNTDLKRRFMGWIGKLRGDYAIVIKPKRATRSNQANRYFHGVVVPAMRDYMNEQQGRKVTNEMAKTAIKDAVIGEDFLIRETGQTLRVIPETHTMDTQQFGEFVEACIAWLAEANVIVPDAEPYRTAAERRAVTA